MKIFRSTSKLNEEILDKHQEVLLGLFITCGEVELSAIRFRALSNHNTTKNKSASISKKDDNK